jgi:hypothetical protein
MTEPLLQPPSDIPAAITMATFTLLLQVYGDPESVFRKSAELRVASGELTAVSQELDALLVSVRSVHQGDRIERILGLLKEHVTDCLFLVQATEAGAAQTAHISQRLTVTYRSVRAEAEALISRVRPVLAKARASGNDAEWARAYQWALGEGEATARRAQTTVTAYSADLAAFLSVK